MRPAKIIRDSIHGDVFLTETEVKIIDTPEFQRLRRIKQLGMSYLVYPGANHTRFEHSIGALHLAGRLCNKLRISNEETKLVRFAALLHDIGHGPLSHTSEELLERYLGQSHEEITTKVIKNQNISYLLEIEDINPKEICKIIKGERGYLSKIISSDFDVDRMDFLVRDAHHTGVAYGIIDLDRLINTLTIHKNSLAVTERGLRAVEALLLARFLMTPTVYLHHTSRIADAMFLRAIEIAIKEGMLDCNEFYRMDDYDIYNFLRKANGYVGEIGRRFDRRELFKKAYVKSWNELSEDVKKSIPRLRKNIEKWRRIEDEMARDLGIEEGYVLLDIPEIPTYKIEAVMVKDNQEYSIEEASPIIKILNEAQKEQWNMAVYTSKENLDRVKNLEVEDYLE